MGAVFGFLFSGIGRWIGMGLVGSLLIGGFIVWHKLNFVSADRAEYWQNYAEGLEKAIKNREELVKKYEKESAEDDETISKLEAERERLLAEDRAGDDPVLLDRGDAERLRKFRKG